MKRTIAVGAALTAALLVSVAVGGDLKSGPQIGEGDKIKPFNPLHVTGPQEGVKACLV